MVDPLSLFIGAFVGICVGFIAGKIGSINIIDQLKTENERLSKEYSRVSTRGPGGRFIKSVK